MSRRHHLQLLGIKPLVELASLIELGWVATSEWVDCPHCSQKYELLIEPAESEPSEINVVDFSQSMRRLAIQIASEHASGHESDLLIVELVSQELLSHEFAPQRSSTLNLQAGEQVTTSWPASALQDCRCCCRCDERSFRVVEIKSGAGTHRYVAMCEEHFTDACLETAELAEVEFAALMLSQKI